MENHSVIVSQECPAEPPEGYRFLQPGEIMNVPGDLYWAHPGQWEPTELEDWPFRDSYRAAIRKKGERNAESS